MIKNFKAVSIELMGAEISNLCDTLVTLEEICSLITEDKECSRISFSSLDVCDIDADSINSAMSIIETLIENPNFEIL